MKTRLRRVPLAFAAQSVRQASVCNLTKMIPHRFRTLNLSPPPTQRISPDLLSVRRLLSPLSQPKKRWKQPLRLTLLPFCPISRNYSLKLFGRRKANLSEMGCYTQRIAERRWFVPALPFVKLLPNY